MRQMSDRVFSSKAVCIGKYDNKNRKLMIISSAGGESLGEIGVAPLRLSSYRRDWTPDADALR
jgi:hypothetical protein